MTPLSFARGSLLKDQSLAKKDSPIIPGVPAPNVNYKGTLISLTYAKLFHASLSATTWHVNLCDERSNRGGNASKATLQRLPACLKLII